MGSFRLKIADDILDETRIPPSESASVLEPELATPRSVPSTLDASTLSRFDALASRWIDGTRTASSFTDIVNHPAYREIVAMRQAVIPAILRDLEREPKHWGPALEAITGTHPVPWEHAGQVKKIAEDWLQWARDHGYAW